MEYTLEQHGLGNSNQPIILEVINNGNYWVLSEQGLHYLFPKKGLTINEHNYKIVQFLFNCHGCYSNYNSYQLIEPALVSPINGGKNWQLYQQGTIQFN